MMTLIEEIQTHFANLNDNKIIEINNPDAEESYVLRWNGNCAVAIRIQSDTEIKESFSQIDYFTKKFTMNEKEQNLLVLLLKKDSLRNEFASLACNFVSLGYNRERRNNLIEAPLDWWKDISELLGNKKSNKKAYSVLAELLVFYYLSINQKDVEWNGPIGSSIDISAFNTSYEIKSTIKRYESIVSINSQYQLQSMVNHYLIFVRLEKDINGVSIDDIVNKLVDIGLESNYLEERLESLQFYKGNSSRKERFKVLQCSEYHVDHSFPKITNESFVNRVLPNHIVNITYSVELTGIEASEIDLTSYL